MRSTLSGILRREFVEIPTYNFKTHSQCEQPQLIRPADVVLLEGILVLYDPRVRDLMNMKLFVDTDSDTRLSRRGKLTPTHTHTHTPYASVLRDIQERGRNLEQVLSQYMNVVKPAFEEFTLPVRHSV